ncbi:MAG: hypothetical protein OEW33_12815 [Nitrospirota bacterium]|nr:hypothetical protein [Nitrospirota bacterium]MDH5296260.1 hypothetical protein [Nitrospirota bacterium]
MAVSASFFIFLSRNSSTDGSNVNDFFAADLPHGIHPPILQFLDKIANPFILFNKNFLSFFDEHPTYRGLKNEKAQTWSGITPFGGLPFILREMPLFPTKDYPDLVSQELRSRVFLKFTDNIEGFPRKETPYNGGLAIMQKHSLLWDN